MEINFFPKEKKIGKYSIKNDSLFVVSNVLAILSFIALFVYWFLLGSRSHVILVNFIFCFVLCTLVSVLSKKIEKSRLLSIILVSYIEVLFLPSFVVYGVEAGSSSPIWSAAGIMIMIFLLELKDFWWIFILALYWNTFLYTKTYVWANQNSVIENRLSYFLGYAFSFLIVGLTTHHVLTKIEKNFNKAEKEIDRSREIEKNAGLAKSRFLANMSHEIRTPMNSIIGLSELVLKDEMDDVTRNEVNVVRRSAYDLLEIIDDVLVYSKLDSGKVKLMNVDFRFDDLLKTILSTISANMGKKDLKVHVNIDHNIPKVLNGDDIKIKQVFVRLVFISLFLTDNGRLMISVKCKRDEKNENAVLNCIISDTGCGLSQYDLDAIYGAYDTYDSRQNSNLRGIGLKFNICKSFLELMDGNIDIRSIEGVGLESRFSFSCKITNPEPMICVDNASQKKVLIYFNDNREYNSWKEIMDGFGIRPYYVNSYFSFDKAIQNTKYDFIFLPNNAYLSVENIITSYNTFDYTYIIADSDQAFGDFGKCRIVRHPVSSLSIVDVLNNQWKADDYTSNSEEIEYDGSNARILVVDDNAVNLKVAVGIFKSYNIDISMAKSGEEALKKMETNEYDLVLMDMVMPELSGTETLRKMRSSNIKMMREVPVVALTANTGGNIREEVLEKGFQEYLAKPIKQRYLTQCLLQFLPPGVLVKRASDKKNDKKPVVKAEKISTSKNISPENTVNFEAGLKNMGGNVNIYNQVLNTFIKEASSKVELLPKMIQNKEWLLVETTVHGVKSSCMSIGATFTSELFKTMEFACKDSKYDIVLNRYENAVKELINTIEICKKYFENSSDIQPGTEDYLSSIVDDLTDKHTDASIIDQDNNQIVKFKESFAIPLKAAIDTMDIAKCNELLDNIDYYLVPDTFKETVEDIKASYELFDFKKLNDLSLQINR